MGLWLSFCETSYLVGQIQCNYAKYFLCSRGKSHEYITGEAMDGDLVSYAHVTSQDIDIISISMQWVSKNVLSTDNSIVSLFIDNKRHFPLTR